MPEVGKNNKGERKKESSTAQQQQVTNSRRQNDKRLPNQEYYEEEDDDDEEEEQEDEEEDNGEYDEEEDEDDDEDDKEAAAKRQSKAVERIGKLGEANDKHSRNLSYLMEAAANDAKMNYRGVLPLGHIAEAKRQAVMRHLEKQLSSDQACAIHSLAWLVTAPEFLQLVRTSPEPLEPHRRYIAISLAAWLLFLVSGALLIVTSFLQVHRAVSYTAGATLGCSCLAFSVVAFAPSRQELAGALTAPVLPPMALRTALSMQRWLGLIASSREELQDLIN